jgi:hypothetical protein
VDYSGLFGGGGGGSSSGDKKKVVNTDTSSQVPVAKKSVKTTVKTTVKAVSKPTPTPPLPAAVPAVEGKSAEPTPIAKPQLLSSAAIKEINTINPNKATTTITTIDLALSDYKNGIGGPDAVYIKTLKALGNDKNSAASVLPYLVGSLPRGDLKSALNDYYQNFV